MANSYKNNKFRSDFTPAQIEGDANNNTPQLDVNYDAALRQMESVTNAISKNLQAVKAEVKKLNEHSKSGKEVQRSTKTCMTKIDKVDQALKTSLKNFTNTITQVEKAELQRMIAWFREQTAAEQATKTTEI